MGPSMKAHSSVMGWSLKKELAEKAEQCLLDDMHRSTWWLNVADCV